MNLSERITEALVGTTLMPSVNVAKEGTAPILVHDDDAAEKWFKKYGSKLVSLTAADYKKIESKLKAAKPQWVTSDKSLTFSVFKNQPYIVTEFSAPGMNRTATLEHVVTGEVVKVPLNDAKYGRNVTFCLGIAESDLVSTPFPHLAVKVIYLTLEWTGNAYRLHDGWTSSNSTDPLDIKHFDKYKSLELV